MTQVPTPDLPNRQVQLPAGSNNPQTLSQLLSTGTGALRRAANSIDVQVDSSGNAISLTPNEQALAQALNDFCTAVDPWTAGYKQEGC